MKSRVELDSDSEDCRPSAALIAAAESKKGAKSFYDKEKDLYYSIDAQEAEKAMGSHPSNLPDNKLTEPANSDPYAKYRVKRPTLEKGEVAPTMHYDAKDDVFYFKADRKKKTKKPSSPRCHQQGFFDKKTNPTPGMTDEELEHRINTQGIRGNQPTEKFVYSEKLGPSAELVKKAKERREKEWALHKNRGLFGYTHYKRNENPSDTGCQLYWKRKDSAPSDHPFDDEAYIFDEQKNQLLYGKRGHFAEVKIDDITKFKEAFKAIMDTEQCRYEHKHINYDEVYHLITLNGGHTPVNCQQKIASLVDEKQVDSQGNSTNIEHVESKKSNKLNM